MFKINNYFIVFIILNLHIALWKKHLSIFATYIHLKVVFKSSVLSSFPFLLINKWIRPADPALTNKDPFPGSYTHTISGTGWEFGPGGQLAVILAWKLAGLSELRHRTRKLETGCNVCRSAIQLLARDGWGRKKKEIIMW